MTDSTSLIDASWAEHPQHALPVGLLEITEGGIISSEITGLKVRMSDCAHVIRWVRDITSLIHEIADDATLEIQKHFRVMYQTADKAPSSADPLAAMVQLHRPHSHRCSCHVSSGWA